VLLTPSFSLLPSLLPFFFPFSCPAWPSPPIFPDGGEGSYGQAAAEARVPAGAWTALWATGAGHTQATGPCPVHLAAPGLAACTPAPTLLRPWQDGTLQALATPALHCYPWPPSCTPASSSSHPPLWLLVGPMLMPALHPQRSLSPAGYIALSGRPCLTPSYCHLSSPLNLCTGHTLR
jgi:hypothetical protein